MHDQSWRRFNTVTLPAGPAKIRIAPYPAPLVLSEPKHDGERQVYESFLTSAPELVGFAAYSMPLPGAGNRRIEADFVALMPLGVALIEVKGGIVGVNSRPGPGVRWAHWTRSGKPTGGSVNPSQLYRVTETFSVMAQAMAGVDFGPRIAQLMVFPHTSRAQIDPAVAARLDAPDRDFMRIVFAEDLAVHSMWCLVDDELRWPGRGHALTADDVTRLIGWIGSELDVRPGPQPLPPDIEEILHPKPKPLSFSMAPPPENRPPLTPEERVELNRFLEEDRRKRLSETPPSAKPAPRYSINKLGIVLALLLAGGIWAGRSGVAPAPVAATPAVDSAPARPTPTPDPIQSALARAVGEPEKRIASGGKDWVRALGPVAGRPDCQFMEMAASGKTYNVIACRDGERGMWRY